MAELLPDIKAEPDDELMEVTENPIPKEFLQNGLGEDSDCEDMSFFTQVEVDNTRKCLENTKLIIKDFETQLDWHLQQYMILRNVFNAKDGEDPAKKQDMLSISQLSALLTSHPEGNKNFIKRKVPANSGGRGGGGGGGAAKRKRRSGKRSEEEESESEEDSEFDEDFDETDEEEEEEEEEQQEGKSKKKKPRGKRGLQVKDEIEEEIHELVEPKHEPESDEEMLVPPKKTPAKRGPRKSKAATKVVDVKEESLDTDEFIEAIKEKCVNALEDLVIDKNKPLAILKKENFDDFDFNECLTSNVVVTFDGEDSLPDFIFQDAIAKEVLNGSIQLVQADIFDQHLAAEED